VTGVDERNQMRRLLVLAALAALATFAAAAPAAAKGPTTASITGPGLDHALPVKGEGEGGTGTPLGSLVQLGGFFPQVFRETPDPTTRVQPTADLGPRYQVAYRVPGPSGTGTIVQDVYPYAKPSPVTYVRAGQRFWTDNRTYGGWFVSTAALKTALVTAGLPEQPPSSGGASFPWAWTGAGAALALVLLTLLALRRRGITRLPALRSTA
jgi:hypothetical protein